MPAAKLKQFLDSQGVRYVVITHSTAYTAQEIASLAHIKGREMAKTVMVMMDGALAMAVLPASYQVDLERLREVAGVDHLNLATETEFRDKFPECETGAMPPFGNLYDIPVYVDESMRKDEEIVFNAGTHRELFRMAYADFERLAQPVVRRFSRTRAGAAAA